jgi:hypothetical protein
MAIYQGLDGFRARAGADPTCIHSDCKQALRKCGGLQGQRATELHFEMRCLQSDRRGMADYG